MSVPHDVIEGCPFRKSYPDVLVLQSSQDRNGNNGARSLDCTMQGLCPQGTNLAPLPEVASRKRCIQSKFDLASLTDVSALGALSLDWMCLDPGGVVCEGDFSTKINGTRNLTGVVDRDTQPNEYSRSNNYLPKHKVGHPPCLLSHGLLTHQILFLTALGSLIVLASGIGAILRAAFRSASLGGRLPLSFCGWTLPADTRGWWNGFRAALLSVE